MKILKFVCGVFLASFMFIYLFMFAVIQQSERYAPLTQEEIQEVVKNG